MPTKTKARIEAFQPDNQDAMNVNVRVTRDTYDRLARCRKGEGFMSDQEVVRIALNEFLKRGGY